MEQLSCSTNETIICYYVCMKVSVKRKVVIVECPTILKAAGYLSAGTEGYKKAKAAAFFPFIFIRNKDSLTDLFINHEKIHHRQQLETLFIGLLLLSVIEKVYGRLFLGFKGEELYLYLASEQEAYRNQGDNNYLTHRRLYSLFWYVRNKKKLSFVEGQAPKVVSHET